MLFLSQEKPLDVTVLEAAQKFFTEYPWLVLAIGGGILIVAAVVIFLVMGSKKRKESSLPVIETPKDKVSPTPVETVATDTPEEDTAEVSENAAEVSAAPAASSPLSPSQPLASSALAPDLPPASSSASAENSEKATSAPKKSAPKKRNPKPASAEKTSAPTVPAEMSATPMVAPASDAPAPTAKTEKQATVSGRYVFVLADDGYHFCLLANNGQLLYESVGYTTVNGAKAGIETFRRAATAKNARFIIRSDRGGKYSYVLNGKFYGEGYTARQRCEKAIQSVKRFAGTENFTEFAFTKEETDRYAAAKASLKTGTDADFAAMEKKSASMRKSGKFVIDTEESGASFSLLANNGKCLYTSRLFSDAATAEKAIYAFKKAVYLDNFFVTDDKFGNFRFALKGTGSNWYVGDSYATKERCANSIESVKQFALSAEITYGTEDEESAED